MKNFVAMALATITFVGTYGCDGNDPLDTCIDDRARITQGVYGQFINSCDTEPCTPSYALGVEVRIYGRNPTPEEDQDGQRIHDAGTSLTPIERARSGEAGFFEVALPPGTYYLCTNDCSAVVLSASQPLVRRDWANGPGGGRWHAGACP